MPPRGAEEAHAELAAALADARDATADVAEAAALGGPEAAAAYVHEWRGALFRVRLARLRLSVAPARPAPRREAVAVDLTSPLLAFALTALGAAGFVLGAVLAEWPLWTAGILLVAGGVLAYRPTP